MCVCVCVCVCVCCIVAKGPVLGEWLQIIANGLDLVHSYLLLLKEPKVVFL